MKFRTPLPVPEAKARLAEALRQSKTLPFTWTGGGYTSDPLIAEIEGERFQIKVGRGFSRRGDSFPPIFYGKFVESMGGTVIAGEFSSPRGKVAFYVVWILLIVVGFAAFGGYHWGDGRLMGLGCFGLGVAALLALVIRLSRWECRQDEQDIVSFLRHRLGASGLDSAPAENNGPMEHHQ